jgi:hypothetical protein
MAALFGGLDRVAEAPREGLLNRGRAVPFSAALSEQNHHGFSAPVDAFAATMRKSDYRN